jgi:hypothetical protein
MTGNCLPKARYPYRAADGRLRLNLHACLLRKSLFMADALYWRLNRKSAVIDPRPVPRKSRNAQWILPNSPNGSKAPHTQRD